MAGRVRVKAEAVKMVEAEGFTVESVEQNKHIKVKASLKGQSRSFVFPTTTLDRDRRSQKNMESTIRRARMEIEGDANG